MTKKRIGAIKQELKSVGKLEDLVKGHDRMGLDIQRKLAEEKYIDAANSLIIYGRMTDYLRYKYERL